MWIALLAVQAPGGAAGNDDLAVVLHAENPDAELSSALLTKILRAEVQHWPGWQRVVLTLPRAETAEKKALLGLVYRMGSEGELKRYWTELVYQNRITEPPRVMPSTGVALRYVEKTRGALAIVKASEADEQGLRIATIDGKGPGEPGYFLRLDPGPGGEAPLPEAPALEPRPTEAAGRPQDSRLQELEDRLAELEAGLGEASATGGLSLGPWLTLRGFGHVAAGLEETDPEAGGTETTASAFALGGLDLFITSKLSDEFSFLNETVFEPTEEGEYVLDVERVILKYAPSDALNLHAGRFHTTLGHWNEAYHHGEWLQTSIGRPAVLAFEDEDGIIPVHLVGLVLKGRRDLRPGTLEYTLEVGNGRGPTPDPPQIVIDANDPKAVNLAFGFEPALLPGAEFGAALYHDDIPPNTDVAAGPLHGTFDEEIRVLYATYRNSPWEAMVEVFEIEHDGQVDTDSSGWYAQAGFTIGAWTPYVRFDGTELDDQDTFFTSVDDQRTLALGVRWRNSTWTALKLQAERREVEAAAPGLDEDVMSLRVQASFAF